MPRPYAYARLDDRYPADGFSRPYQLGLALGSLLVSFLGLYLLVRNLRPYFPERAVALTLVLITIGTNYLNYSAIDGALTHNYLFTLYALLILLSRRFYRRAGDYSFGTAAAIGATLGLMALTRPTELLAVIIPLCWDMQLTGAGISGRVRTLGAALPRLAVAAGITAAIGSWQLIYWKYVTGSWLVYSYQDQGFDWLQPHLVDGLFSYKAGWLTYTPLMYLALVGFGALYRYRRRGIFFAPLLHTLLFVYVAFSWSVWWYGGSLGQRTMVQAYAVLAFPLAAGIAWVQERAGWVRLAFYLICTLFVAHNLWFTHQAHRGGLLAIEWTNRSYYWRTLFTFERNDEDRLLLDNPEFYRGTPTSIDTLYTNDFERDTFPPCSFDPIDGRSSICLGPGRDNSPEYRVAGPFARRQWVKASVDCKIREGRGGNVYNYAQLVMRFYRGGERVKERIVRLHRVLNNDWERSVTIEARAPWDGADAVSVFVWNGGSEQPELMIDNLSIVTLK